MQERRTIVRRALIAPTALVAAGLLALGVGCNARPPDGAPPPDAPAGERTTPDTASGEDEREAAPDTIPYDLSAAQWNAVSALLRDHPTWSLLSAEANTNPLLERWQEERPVLGEFYTDRLDTYRWNAGRGRLVLHVPDAPELRG